MKKFLFLISKFSAFVLLLLLHRGHLFIPSLCFFMGLIFAAAVISKALVSSELHRVRDLW